MVDENYMCRAGVRHQTFATIPSGTVAKNTQPYDVSRVLVSECCACLRLLPLRAARVGRSRIRALILNAAVLAVNSD